MLLAVNTWQILVVKHRGRVLDRRIWIFNSLVFLLVFLLNFDEHYIFSCSMALFYLVFLCGSDTEVILKDEYMGKKIESQ